MGWVGAFYAASIGKKIVVAATGLVMVLFLTGHMLGNLQIFEGRGPTPDETRLNEYAELLRVEMGLLWAIRAGLLIALFLHVFTSSKITLENRAARPEGYATRTYREAGFASRTMIWGGIAIFLYVVYHIGHFTAHQVHTDLLVKHDIYSGVVQSFQNPWISAVYIAAGVALFFHLSHAILSMFQTLGLHHPRHTELIRILGRVYSFVIVVGFISVPIAVLLGIVK